MKTVIQTHKSLILFFSCLLFSYLSFAQQILLHPSTWNNYGPYYVEDPDTTHIQVGIENLTSTTISGTLSFQIYKDATLIAELKQAYRPFVTIPSYGTVLAPAFTSSENVDEIDFSDLTFKTQLLTGVLLFDSTYSIKFIFNYVYENNSLEENEIVIIGNYIQAPKICIFPEHNDTLSIQAPEVEIFWSRVIFNDNRISQYQLKIYPVASNQTDSVALITNTPLIDTLIDSCISSYTWVRGKLDKNVIMDSAYVPFERYIITVASVLGAGETNPLWNNLGNSALNFADIPYPWFNSQFDTIPHLHEGHRWAFSTEMYGDSVFPPSSFYKTNAPNQINSICPNGVQDQNDFTGWFGFTGSHSVNEIILNIPGINYVSGDVINNQHDIVQKSDGLDPTTQQFPVVSPIGGNYAFRIGNLRSGHQASCLGYSFIPSSTNSSLRFLYALVLEDDLAHLKNVFERPMVEVNVFDVTTSTTIMHFQVYADVTSSFFKSMTLSAPIPNMGMPTGSRIAYKEWTCLPIDLSSYVGHNIIVSFVSTDCTQSDHRGYAYIDLVCSRDLVEAEFTMDTVFCIDQNISADGSSSDKEMNHYWKIEECNAGGTPNTQTTKIKYFYSKEAGTIDIKLLYRILGGNWRCDQYYKITLGVENSCESWVTTSKVIYINPCLEADAGEDRSICNVGNQTATIGHVYSPPPSNVTFSWSPTTQLSNPNSSSTQASPFITTQYILTTTSGNNCVSKDTVTVYVQGDADFTIESDTTYCIRRLWIEPVYAGDYTVQWSGPNGFSSSNKVIFVFPNALSTYTATVTNACGIVSHSISVPAILFDIHYPNYFLTLFGKDYTYSDILFQYGDVLVPSSSIDINKKLYIFDTRFGSDISFSSAPAYFSTAFQFRIYNRWGQKIREIEPPLPANGFKNGDINWDGKTAQGNWAQQDEYKWKLRVKNCSYSNWWQYQKKLTFRAPLGPIPFAWYNKTIIIDEFPVYLIY